MDSTVYDAISGDFDSKLDGKSQKKLQRTVADTNEAFQRAFGIKTLIQSKKKDDKKVHFFRNPKYEIAHSK